MIEQLNGPDRLRCVEIIEAFERAWFRGESPTIDTYLPVECAWRCHLLVELVLIDAEFRQRCGETVDLNLYMTRYRELNDDSNAKAVLRAEIGDSTKVIHSSKIPPKCDIAESTYHRTNSSATALATSDAQFRIRRLHSHGGLGQVFVAVDEELQREVALKEIRPQYADDPDCRRRFVSEVKITGSLEHPGIVPVYRLGWYADGRPFYAMRFIRGESLKDALAAFHRKNNPYGREQQQWRLGLREFLRRFIDVCNAVEYAHNQGIIHRDLKPANIMLGKFGETLVVDWGLAKRFDAPVLPMDVPLPGNSYSDNPHETLTGSSIGTPGYMSPEQAEGRTSKLTPATDIYSLGATLNYLLTGRPPTPSKPNSSAADKTVSPAQFDCGKNSNSIPRALREIAKKATAPLPQNRYASAKSLAEDIERWLADEPVQAYQESLPVKFARWTRRHLTIVGTVISLVFVSLTATTIASFAISKEHEKALKAERQLFLAERQTSEADKKAEFHRRTAAEIANLLQQLFRSADPIGLEGFGMRDGKQRAADVTARQLLDAAATEVRERLIDSPELQSSLFETLGNSYRSLSEYHAAEKFLNESLSIRIRLFGDDHVQVASSLFSLGILKQDIGEYDQAERLYRKALALQSSLDGSDNLLVARMNFQLGWLLSQQPYKHNFQSERSSEAEDFMRTALKIRREQLGENHHDVGVTLAALAGIRMARGDERECFTLLIEAFRVLDQPDNASDIGSATVFFIQGEALRKIGKYDEGAEVHQKVVEIVRRQLGSQHPMYALMLANLAGTQRQAGNLVEAEKNIRETISIARRSSMRSQPNMLDILIQFADGLRGRQDYTEAESVYREAIQYGGETDDPSARALVDRAQQHLDQMLQEKDRLK